MMKTAGSLVRLVVSAAIATAVSATGAVVSTPTVASAANLVDTDGDGLPDVWEAQGYDADGDGKVDVDLPAMGATPDHKDIFVEMDYMAGRLPGTAAFDQIVASFADGPASNPDGRRGVRIHLDGGSAVASKYNLGGGNEVPYQANLTPAIDAVNAVKAANFASARNRVFHYMIWGDDYDDSCSSGLSLDIPADTFIVTMGPKCQWDPVKYGDTARAGTFIHELGHNLGLLHGGTDDTNFKPNYLSVMNYAFQFRGVPRVGGTRYLGYSTTTPIDLDENALSEIRGLGLGGLGFKTIYVCDDLNYLTGSAVRPIDWDCNDSIGLRKTTADINNDGIKGVLRSQNNWAALNFSGGGIGPSPESTQRRAAVRSTKEVTKKEVDRLSLATPMR